MVYKSNPSTYARHGFGDATLQKKGFGHAKELGDDVIACQGFGDANELGNDVINWFL